MPQESQYRYGGFDPKTYLTLTAMRLEDRAISTNPELAVVTGGTVAFDVTPSGLYAWNAADVSADNGTTIIKVTAITTGRWNRIAS